MRHSIKPLLAALLALVALAALTSSPASAATCKKGESEAEHKTLCVEGKQVGSPKEAVTTTAEFTQKTGTSAVISNSSQEWSVTCARVEASEAPVIKSGGGSGVTLEKFGFRLGECKVVSEGKEVHGCSVEGAVINALSGSLATPESIKLTNGGTFGGFTINGCVLAAGYTITGSQGCSLKQPEVEAITKELVCEPKNSELAFSGGFGKATFKLEGNLALAGTSKGKKFSITK